MSIIILFRIYFNRDIIRKNKLHDQLCFHYNNLLFYTVVKIKMPSIQKIIIGFNKVQINNNQPISNVKKFKITSKNKF
jgi:hypothetical protein